MHFSFTKNSDGFGQKVQWFQELVWLLNWRHKAFSWKGALQSELRDLLLVLWIAWVARKIYLSPAGQVIATFL